MRSFFESFWTLSQELAFPLFVGAAIAGVLHLFLDKRHITKYLSGNKCLVVIKSVFLGLPLPICSCGVLPLAVSLRSKGLSKGGVNGFLVSTPQTGIDSFLVASSFFSLPFAFAKLLIALILGLITGIGSNLIEDEETFLIDDEAVESAKENKFKSWWQHSLMVLESIWLWLFIGIAISSLISVLAESLELSKIIEPFTLWQQMGLMLLISLPLYVCATASIPIAAGFVLMGVHPAAALVFLIAGPATNAAVILPISKILGWRHVFLQLFVVIVGSCLGAYLFSFLLPQTAELIPCHSHHNSSWYKQVSAFLLMALFLRQSLLSMQDKFKATDQGLGSSFVTYVYSVEGIHCQSCVNKIQAASESLDDFALVDINKSTQEFSFRSSLESRSVFLERIKKLGFTNIKEK
ncbi:permease [Lentisphaera profundi]|uniref:Permease n=1 Tax=Lentisphaera profundi TaxID=1658616 RepID=A0ABY7VTH3_9BACT|nr:permease [Lentisphaera profundi]WDE97027.1 permease [Lentisphaera profundi]